MHCPMFFSCAYSSVNELIEVIEMRKDDVASHVKQEAFCSDIRACEPSCFVECIHQHPIIFSLLIQASCCSKPTRP